MKPVTALTTLVLTFVVTALAVTPVQAQPPLQVPESAPAHVQPLPTLRDQAT